MSKLRPRGSHQLYHAVADSAASVHRQTAGLVDDQQAGVLEDDALSELLATSRKRRRRHGLTDPNRRNAHLITGFQPVFRAHGGHR